MLQTLHLHPYKVHSDVRLADLPSVAILVGPNNSGKSAVLQAAALPKYGLSWNPILPTSPWEAGVKTDGLAAAVDLAYDSGVVNFHFTRSSDSVMRVSVGDSRGNKTESSADIPPLSQFGGHVGFNVPLQEARAVYYISAFRATPTRAFQHREFDRDLGPDGGGCWNALLQLKADDDPRFGEVETVMSTLGLGVRRLKTPGVAAGLGRIRMENYGRSDALSYLGSGAACALTVVTQGALCEPGDLFLVEEPELHLHRSASDGLGAFFCRLVRRGVQVILTTHSTAFFSSLFLGMENDPPPKGAAVFVFGRESSGQTSVKRVPLESYHEAVNAANAVLRKLP